jgi:hypothetical protein
MRSLLVLIVSLLSFSAFSDDGLIVIKGSADQDVIVEDLDLRPSNHVKQTETISASDSEWDTLNGEWKEYRTSQKNAGYGLMLGGALASLGGAAGYRSTDDPFAQGAFTLTESLGILAIGSGLKKVWLTSDKDVFLKTIHNDSGITSAEKLRLYKSYTLNKKAADRKVEQADGVTYALIALLNFYNAREASDATVRQTLQAFGLVNSFLAIQLIF